MKPDYEKLQKSIDLFHLLYTDPVTGEQFDAEVDMQTLLDRAVLLEKVAEAARARLSIKDRQTKRRLVHKVLAELTEADNVIWP